MHPSRYDYLLATHAAVYLAHIVGPYQKYHRIDIVRKG